MARYRIRRTRRVDPSGAWRRHRSLLLSLVLVAGAALAVNETLQAITDGFELDRNAVAQAAVPGDDWSQIFSGGSSAGATAFVADGQGPTIFTGGGSKDDLNTTSWQHKTGSTPPKDELLDAFAARYGDRLYFGADRYAGNGDAVMGFWFFQQEVVPQPNGTFGPGQHQDGDILVLSDFSNGGAAVTIRVFRWNGPGGDIPGAGAINGTLDLLAGTETQTADCVGPPAVPVNFPYCATVNTQSIPSPWPFQGSTGAPNTIPSGQFLEGGIDLGFLNLGEECFASFLAETRSSTSVDATLKDFVGGTFERCTSQVKTTPSDSTGAALSSIVLGQSIHDYALITGTGSNVAPSGTMTFYICSPTELTNGTCATGGTLVSTNAVVPANPATTPPSGTALSAAYTPNAIGTWCWRGEYSGDDNYPASEDASTGECFQVVQLQPTIATAQRYTVFDTAVITVPAGAGDLAGTIRFQLYLNDPTCAGTAIYDSGPNAVSGPSPQQATSGTFTLMVPGTHVLSWKVSYVSTKTGHKDATSTCHNENGTVAFTNGVTQP